MQNGCNDPTCMDLCFMKFMRLYTVILLGIIACKPKANSDKVDFDYSIAVEQKAITYLESNVATHGFGGKSICATSFLGADSTALYLLYYCQEFYKSNGNKLEGTGEAGPIAMYYEIRNGTVKFMGHKKPRDGNLYAKDIKVIFPEWVQEGIKNNESEMSRMHTAIKKRISNTDMK